MVQVWQQAGEAGKALEQGRGVWGLHRDQGVHPRGPCHNPHHRQQCSQGRRVLQENVDNACDQITLILHVCKLSVIPISARCRKPRKLARYRIAASRSHDHLIIQKKIEYDMRKNVVAKYYFEVYELCMK